MAEPHEVVSQSRLRTCHGLGSLIFGGYEPWMHLKICSAVKIKLFVVIPYDIIVFVEVIRMADEIKQLIDMLAKLKITVDEGFSLMNNKFESIDKRFESIDKRFDNVETAIKELNYNQIKILNSIKLIESDVRNNKKHIERLEEKENFL
jgi:hypothetical protein